MLDYAKRLWQENPDQPQVQAAVRKLTKADLVRFVVWLYEKHREPGTCPASVDKLNGYLIAA